MPLRSLFVDFNSYFASVEQQLQPQLRGKPVAVVPLLSDSTSCIAASYEAKALGITTGTRVGEARRICRHLKIVEARPQLYVQYHHRLVAAVQSCIPVTQVLSVDEMTCDLHGSERSRDVSTRLAQRVKETIYRDVGAHLKCSIGIAPNTFLAKTATELQKPDGLVVIEDHDLPHCLHDLKLRDLCGIGAAMERRLFLRGIVTVRHLCAASRETLKQAWGGVEGERMYDNLRGEWVLRPSPIRSSLGHSHVLSPEHRSEAGARSTLCRLLQKAATRLRKMEYCAGGMQIFIKYLGKFYWTQKIKFAHTCDTTSLMHIFNKLWLLRPQDNDCPVSADAFLGVGVTLFHLRAERDCNLSLFDTTQTRRALHKRVDGLNEELGSMKVYMGGAHLARSTRAAPIAFGFIPELMRERKPRRKKSLPQPELLLNG